jgi:uncharacterized protein DUF2846
MLSTKRTPLVMAAIALWTVIGPADPLQGQEKESEADRIRRGCGPPDIKHGVRINAIGRVRQMTADKALIHVVRPEAFGSLIQTKLAVDGRWMGVNLGGTYFTVSLEPGEHLLCSEAGNRALMDISVEAGRTYYVEQHPVKNFVGKMKNSLRLLDDKEGVRALIACRQSEAFEKAK